jgi:hypothetical protein
MASIPGIAAILAANAAASPVPPKISTLLFLVIQIIAKRLTNFPSSHRLSWVGKGRDHKDTKNTKKDRSQLSS